jgi:hypothetical protein
MNVDVACPFCSTVFTVRRELLGKRAKCVTCKKPFVLCDAGTAPVEDGTTNVPSDVSPQPEHADTELNAPIIRVEAQPSGGEWQASRSYVPLSFSKDVFVYGRDGSGEDGFDGISTLRFILWLCTLLLLGFAICLLFLAIGTFSQKHNHPTTYDGIDPSIYFAWAVGLAFVAFQCWAQRDLLTIAVLLSAHAKHQSDVLRAIVHELREARVDSEVQEEILTEIAAGQKRSFKDIEE